MLDYSAEGWDNFFDSLDYEEFAVEAMSMFPDLVMANNPTKKRPEKVDFWQSNWGVMILHPDVRDPGTKLGKLFRRRFRVPFFIFENTILSI